MKNENLVKMYKQFECYFKISLAPLCTACVLSIYNLKLDRDCGQHSNSQSAYLCVLLRNQNWLKIGQPTSIARDLYFLSPHFRDTVEQNIDFFQNIQVIYIWSNSFQFTVELHDLYQAEDKITIEKAEQMHKMTTVFTQNDNFF